MTAPTLRRVLGPGNAPDFNSLCSLLQDSVEDGASLGFLAPLAHDTASAYWLLTLAALGDGLLLWVAEDAGVVVGSVQLALSTRENGRHRAEVQKLMVRSTHRGQGLASELMEALETHARRVGRTLLVLDTQQGSAAEAVYQRLAWHVAGTIPGYALAPDGSAQATTLFYKTLSP
jgi:acetyltransferase